MGTETEAIPAAGQFGVASDVTGQIGLVRLDLGPARIGGKLRGCN